MTASREMYTDELVEAMENLHLYPRLIAERAAKEAVAAERERIAAAVRELPGTGMRGFGTGGNHERMVWGGQESVNRAAVLAIVEEP